jgi:hypothetical protein
MRLYLCSTCGCSYEHAQSYLHWMLCKQKTTTTPTNKGKKK